MHQLQGGAGTLHYLWNGSGIELAEGGFKHVGFREPVSEVRVHHLSQSAACVMYTGK